MIEPFPDLSPSLYSDLEWINERPQPFEFYSAKELWTEDHTSQQMLAFHLDSEIDFSSRTISFIEKSVGWMADRFKISEGVSVIDIGCGPGLYTSRLAKLGASVSGIDFSPRSINYARKQAELDGLEIDYHEANYLEFQPERQFDLVTMIMCDFCALSPTQRKVMLKLFHRILKPGGRIVLDVYSLNAFDQREETSQYDKNLLDGFWSPHPYFGFLNTFKYDVEKVILDKYTIIEPESTKQIYNWLQYFSVEMLERECKSMEFEIEEVIGDVAGGPFTHQLSEFAVILKLYQHS